MPGDPMWLIHNPNDGTHIKVVKMTNVLSNSASTVCLDPNSLALPAADHFVPVWHWQPPQP